MLPFTLLQQSGHQPETKGRCCDAVCFFYEVYFLSLCIHAVCLFISLVCTVSTRGSLPLRNDFVYRANFHTCTVIHAALCDGKPLPKMGAITNRPDTCQTGAWTEQAGGFLMKCFPTFCSYVHPQIQQYGSSASSLTTNLKCFPF